MSCPSWCDITITHRHVERRCNHRGASCAHRRFEPQAYQVGPEPVRLREIVGLTMFVLFMFVALIYALPIILEGMS